MSRAASSTSSPIPSSIQMQAAEWLVELQADDLEPTAQRQLQRRLDDWRQASPVHEQAWQRVQSLGTRLQPLVGGSAGSVLAEAARQASQSAPGSVGRRRAVRQLAVLLFAGGAAAMAVVRHTPYGEGTWLADLGADWRTGTGEHRSERLPDGTRLQLGTASAVDIDYGNALRLVRLRGGDLQIETGHEGEHAAWPFVVETRHGRIRALGTVFTVRQRAGGPTQVAVQDGAVEISPRGDNGANGVMTGAPLRLAAGQAATFDERGVSGARASEPSDTAWTHDMLIVHDLPLADFVAELARYRPGYLGCDPAVAGLRVSGTYPLAGAADTDRALDMLLATQPVRLRHATRYWVKILPIG